MGRSWHKIQITKRKIQKGYFRVGRNYIYLVTHQDKIVIPQKLQKYIINWYHTYLLHPRLDRTEAMIHQHLFWTDIVPAIRKYVKHYYLC